MYFPAFDSVLRYWQYVAVHDGELQKDTLVFNIWIFSLTPTSTVFHSH